MEPSFNFLPVWMLWTMGIAGFVVAVSTLRLKLIKPGVELIKDGRDWLNERKQDHDDLKAVMVKVTNIEGQLFPNGGSSMFDHVKRLSDDMKEIKERTEVK